MLICPTHSPPTFPNCPSHRNENSTRHQPRRIVARRMHGDSPSNRDQSARLCIRVDAKLQQSPRSFRPRALSDRRRLAYAHSGQEPRSTESHGFPPSQRWVGSPSQMSDVTSIHTHTSRLLIITITTNRTSGVTCSSSDPGTSQSPTPSQRVRLWRQAGLATYPNDLPDKVFFGYDPTGCSDDEGTGRMRASSSPFPDPCCACGNGTGIGISGWGRRVQDGLSIRGPHVVIHTSPFEALGGEPYAST